MDYETLDWDAEAARIIRAFGISQPVQFLDEGLNEGRKPHLFKYLRTLDDDPTIYLSIPADLEMDVTYHSPKQKPQQLPLGLKFFRVFRAGTMIEGTSMYQAKVELNWDGSVSSDFYQFQKQKNSFYIPSGYFGLAQVLAKGLFHLDLLSPEVEDVLELNITAHQKLEWALEYDSRMNAENGTETPKPRMVARTNCRRF